MDRLHVQLFTNYDKTAHPMATPTERTNTTIYLSIGYIDIDELNGKMTLHGWITLVSNKINNINQFIKIHIRIYLTQKILALEGWGTHMATRIF